MLDPSVETLGELIARFGPRRCLSVRRLFGWIARSQLNAERIIGQATPPRIASLSIRLTKLLPYERRAGYSYLCYISCTTAIMTTTHEPFMTQPSFARPNALIISAFVVLVMLDLALAGSVEAACGHGSLSKTQREVGGLFEHLEIFSIDQTEHQAVPDGPGRRPCSGPSCSGRNPSGPNVPIPPSFEMGDRWIYAVVCLDINSSYRARHQLGEASPLPVTQRAAVERPPRSLPTCERA